MILLASLGFGAAVAHPFDSALFGHQLDVYLDPDAVELSYTAEIPTRRLLGELGAFIPEGETPGPAHQAAFTERMLDELEGGLRLVVDGQVLPWSRLPVEGDSGLGDARFISYVLRLRAPLPAGTRGFNLVNENRPDEPSLFATELYVAEEVLVDACSLLDIEAGEIIRDRAGQWRADEVQRELRVSLRPRPGWAIGWRAWTEGLRTEDFVRVHGRAPVREVLSSVHGTGEPVAALAGAGALVFGLVLLGFWARARD